MDWFLPSNSPKIPLQFLQQLLTRQKEYVKQTQIPKITLPKIPELSSSYLLDKKIIPLDIVKRYLPDDPYKVDRQFIYSVWSVVDFAKASAYFNKVVSASQMRKAPER